MIGIKIYLKRRCLISWLILTALMGFMSSGCSFIWPPPEYPQPRVYKPPQESRPAPYPPQTTSPPPQTIPAPAPAPAPTIQEKAPPTGRELASLTLTEQGQNLLAQGKVDQAISTLERAASLNPDSGPNHYWLAEAWIAKRNRLQAYEHHQLARQLLNGRANWRHSLLNQAKKINRIK